MVAVYKVYKKGLHHFAIEWSDAITTVYSLAVLQQNCPCILCSDKRKNPMGAPCATAKSLKSVGRYALQIEFTSGCSKGIYTFSFLRALAKECSSC